MGVTAAYPLGSLALAMRRQGAGFVRRPIARWRRARSFAFCLIPDAAADGRARPRPDGARLERPAPVAPRG